MNSPSDIDRRMHAAAERVLVGEPPLEAIVRGGRRRRAWRHAAQISGAVVVVAVLAGVLVNLRGLGETDLELSNGARIRKPIVVGTTVLPPDAIPVAVASSEDSVWVVDSAGTGRLIRIDATTGRIYGEIPLGVRSASDISVDGSSVWVAGYNAVLRIDPRTDQVVKRIRFPERSTSLEGIQDMDVAEGSVWLTLTQRGLLVRLDPDTGRVRAVVELPVAGGRIVVADGSVWVAGCTCEQQPPRLYQVDPRANRLTGTFSSNGNYRQYGSFQAIAADGSGFWLLSAPVDPGPGVSQHAWLWRFDLLTRRFNRRPTEVGRSIGGLALAEGGAWVVHQTNGAGASVLSLVDPGNGRIVGPSRSVGALASGIASGRGLLWVTSYRGSAPVVYRVRP
jgi:streptogramin lyase